MFVKIRKIHSKIPTSVSFFNKVAGLGTEILLKKTLAQVFYCEFCKSFKNNFFTEHLRSTAFGSRKFSLNCVVQPSAVEENLHYIRSANINMFNQS